MLAVMLVRPILVSSYSAISQVYSWSQVGIVPKRKGVAIYACLVESLVSCFFCLPSRARSLSSFGRAKRACNAFSHSAMYGAQSWQYCGGTLHSRVSKHMKTLIS
jgi:hypothetical protein